MYKGHAMVFWTFTIENRQKGWLTPTFHARFREGLFHASSRQGLSCPVYCLMPDHLHFLWLGLKPSTDQRNAISFLRTHVLPEPASWQHQPHDHVLKDKERELGAVQQTVNYILENPVRAKLVDRWQDWQYTGVLVPGYPRLDIRDKDFWERYWKIYAVTMES